MRQVWIRQDKASRKPCKARKIGHLEGIGAAPYGECSRTFFCVQKCSGNLQCCWNLRPFRFRKDQPKIGNFRLNFPTSSRKPCLSRNLHSSRNPSSTRNPSLIRNPSSIRNPSLIRNPSSIRTPPRTRNPSWTRNPQIFKSSILSKPCVPSMYFPIHAHFCSKSSKLHHFR